MDAVAKVTHGTIQAPYFFRITIEGNRFRVAERTNIEGSGLSHLLNRLVTGQTVAANAFSHYGLTVTIEEDVDQGDDVPWIIPPSAIG